VTEPGLTPEQRVARVRELRQEADAAMSAYQSRIAAAGQARERALGVTGQASSRDGSVRVTVDSTGVVTGLELAPSALEKYTPEKLSTAIVATIQEAAAQARATMAEAMAPLRESGAAARAATAGVPELAALRFEVPAVPRTATDPTGPERDSRDSSMDTGWTLPAASPPQPALSEDEAEEQLRGKHW
jgi:DNA-binding protein YbaB